jgi:glutamate-1-semialdehyde 2,1-aminomutase
LKSFILNPTSKDVFNMVSIRCLHTTAAGVSAVIREYNLPWIVKRLGCRVEYWFRPTAPINGSQAAAAVDADLDRFMHLAALNRGILMTPFHNMALMCPQTTAADVDAHTRVFRECAELLLGMREPAEAASSAAARSKL